MQSIFIVVTLLLFNSDIFSQEQTIFGGDNETGGFGGPVIKFTSIRDQNALLFGGRGGWIFNHSLIIGGGLYGIVSEVDAAAGALPEEGPLDIKFGYGGLELEYLYNSHSLIHITGYILIGAGVTNYIKDVGSYFESNEQSGETDLLFVIEPAVNSEMNITPWFRLDAGVSYRLVTGINQPGLEDFDLSGFTVLLAFKFGKF